VLNITITTYVDELHVTFIALREAIPDLERLADYTAEALPALAADLARGRRSYPAQRRPRAPKPRRKPRTAAQRPAAR